MIETSLADSWGGIALLYAGFLYFLAGSLGYGNFFRRSLVRSPSVLEAAGDTTLLASLLLVAGAWLLCALHVLPFVPRLVWWLLPYGGLFFLADVPVRSFCRRSWPLVLLFGFIFLLRSLTAAIPSQHGDPLLYHLLGPRLWARAGGFVMDPLLPNALLASSWENLYVWPQLLFGGEGPLRGLVEAQVYAQWLHLFLGWGGCALLVPRLFRGAVSPRALPLLALAALFVSGVHWTAPLAKNDAGIAFWSLGCLVFLREGWERDERRKLFLAGVFAGLAISGKVTAVLSIAPVGFALLLAYRPWRNFIRDLALLLAGLVLGAVPTYARNLVLSGNPFFPLFSGLFPSKFLSHSWGAHFAQVAPSSPLGAFARIGSRLADLSHESPWIIAVLVLPAVLFFRGRKSERAAPFTIAGALVSYVVFVTTQAPEIELRYLGAALMILAAGGVWALCALADWLVSERVSRAWCFVLLAGLLATSKLPLHVLRKIWSGPIGTSYVRSVHTAGEAKAWLREHAWPSRVVLAGENESYYLTQLSVTPLTEQPELDAATWNETDLLKFVTAVCRVGNARLLLDTHPEGFIERRFGHDRLAPAIIYKAPGEHGAQLYDLYLLEAKLAPHAETYRCRSL